MELGCDNVDFGTVDQDEDIGLEAAMLIAILSNSSMDGVVLLVHFSLGKGKIFWTPTQVLVFLVLLCCLYS